ncbi:MAG: carboxypeptidase regulatory-like domain-containing protein [Bryobacterales bacterium]|nr:carboxypeptidase regulatory-like domain-containing protein [Bryobacterales bacterium]
MSYRSCVTFSAAFLLSGVLLFGQSTTQTIQGIVTDTTGAAIAGARVTATNQATNVAQTATTNDSGNYTFPLVPVGDYTVKCEVAGFKVESVRNIRVETAAQVRQDFKLSVGSLTESIEVVASGVALQTENATVGAVIENRRITELPLNGRNMQNLAVLVPGVQFGLRTGLGDGSSGFPIPGQGFSVSANGQRETSQVASLDGVDAKDPRIHIMNFVPSIEAIEEFKIQTNAYNAEYGFGSGAVVSVTMKSGTNQLHGAFFDFLRNDAFDAENYFLNFERAAGTERAKKNTLRQNQFGLVLSGPVMIPKLYNGKNKTFWAFNWESRRTREGVVQTSNWPIDPFREGDFSLLQKGYEANGRFVNPTIIWDPDTGQVFPNNVIPKSRLFPGALNVLNLYIPKAQFVQQDPLDFTARAAVPTPTDVNTYFARVDHNFSSSDRVFARLAWDRSGLTRSNINPNLPVFVDSKVTNLATQWIHTFSPNMINEARFGFNISDDLTSNPRTDNTSFDMDKLGVGLFRIPSDGSRKLTAREHGIPQFTGLPFTLQELTNGNGYDNMRTWQFGDHVSYFKGKHNLKMGAEYYGLYIERGAANLEEGLLGFSGAQAGYSFASFLLGRPKSTQTPEGLPLTFPSAHRAGAYINDDWKVSSRLTVNLGLRWDYNGWPVDSHGLQRTFDIPGLGTSIGRGAGYKKGDGTIIPSVFPGAVDSTGAVKLMEQQKFRFIMPRIGIAFRPTDKWVIRTGAGWFDALQHQNTYTIFNLMPPKAGSQVYQTSMHVAQTIPVAGSNGNTYNISTQTYVPGSNVLTLSDPFLTSGGGRRTIRPVDVLYVPPDYKDGQVWKWSFDIQRELPSNMALTIGYVGSKGANVGNSVINWNDPLQPAQTFFQANRPYPEFYDPATPGLGVQATGRIRYIDSYGEDFYHALQAKLDKRFSRGLTFGISYTYSKTNGDGENGGQEGASFQNPRDRRGSRGLLGFDQTQRLVANWVYELPGRHIKSPVRWVIGGWQLNGILSLASGFPLNIGQSGADLALPNGAVRPDVISDPKLDNPTRRLWYNPQAFQRVTCQINSRPDLCHLGSNGYNSLRGPGERRIDFSMYKNFPIGERSKLQFRWEAFNATNSPWFNNPGGISFSNANVIIPDGSRNGEIRSLRTPMRRMQFGLKFLF